MERATAQDSQDVTFFEIFKSTGTNVFVTKRHSIVREC